LPRVAAPNDTQPLVQLIQVNVTGKHQQPGSDEVFPSPPYAAEPSTGDHSCAFGADIVAALSGFA
jgi:hypothetical protein